MTTKQIAALKIAIECVEPEVARELEKLLKTASKFKISDEWVKQWLLLWPTRGDVHSYNSHVDYSPRTSFPETRDKFLRLFKNNLFDKACPHLAHLELEDKLAHIYAATEFYLEEKKRKNYEYISKASHFVHYMNKDGSVTLRVCQILNDMVEKPKQSKFEHYA